MRQIPILYEVELELKYIHPSGNDPASHVVRGGFVSFTIDFRVERGSSKPSKPFVVPKV